ncbi:hypothetical protein H6769_07330 [Candidatus Peribacteria bacterium]|nr:hypothetical protein [Candidatus Peribacteria bacterium]
MADFIIYDIDELNLSVKSKNILLMANIQTIADLTQTTEMDLLAVA